MCAWSSSSEPVEAVLFDLGNTPVHYYRAREFGPVLERCVAAAARALDAPVDVAAAQARAVECNAERADLAVWPLAERLERVFGVALPPGARRDALISAFLAPIFATARLDPGALATLGALRRLGLKTAIVSNTPWGSPATAWRAELERRGRTHGGSHADPDRHQGVACGLRGDPRAFAARGTIEACNNKALVVLLQRIWEVGPRCRCRRSPSAFTADLEARLMGDGGVYGTSAPRDHTRGRAQRGNTIGIPVSH